MTTTAKRSRHRASAAPPPTPPTSVLENVLLFESDLRDTFMRALVPTPDDAEASSLESWSKPRAINRLFRDTFDAKVADMYGCPRSLGMKAHAPKLESVLAYFSVRKNASAPPAETRRVLANVRPIMLKVNRLQMAVAASRRIHSLDKALASANLRWKTASEASEDVVARFSVMLWVSMSSTCNPVGGLRRVMDRLTFVHSLHDTISAMPKIQSAFLKEKLLRFPQEYAGMTDPAHAKAVVQSILTLRRRDIEYRIRDQARIDDQVTEAWMLRDRLRANVEARLGVRLTSQELERLIVVSDNLSRDVLTCQPVDGSQLAYSRKKIPQMCEALVQKYTSGALCVA